LKKLYTYILVFLNFARLISFSPSKNSCIGVRVQLSKCESLILLVLAAFYSIDGLMGPG